MWFADKMAIVKKKPVTNVLKAANWLLLFFPRLFGRLYQKGKRKDKETNAPRPEHKHEHEHTEARYSVSEFSEALQMLRIEDCATAKTTEKITICLEAAQLDKQVIARLPATIKLLAAQRRRAGSGNHRIPAATTSNKKPVDD